MSRRLYAQGTTVSIDRTISAITREVEKIGAQRIATVRDGTRYVFAFEIGGRQFRYPVEVDPENPAESRRRWRVAFLQIKTRVALVLEAGESISEAFMPHHVLPDGRRAMDVIEPQLAAGKAPRLLPEGS